MGGELELRNCVEEWMFDEIIRYTVRIELLEGAQKVEKIAWIEESDERDEIEAVKLGRRLLRKSRACRHFRRAAILANRAGELKIAHPIGERSRDLDRKAGVNGRRLPVAA